MRPMSGYTLFRDLDWFSVAHNVGEQLKADVLALDADRLLSSPIDDLCDYFEQMRRLHVPELKKDQIFAEQNERDIDVSFRGRDYGQSHEPCFVKGTEISISIPFEGDGNFFKVKPSSWSSYAPYGEVRNNTLILRVAGASLEGKAVRGQVDTDILKIEGYLTNLRSNVDPFNAGLQGEIRKHLEARRSKLLADRNLVSSLGFRLKDRPDSPKTFIAPEVRRRLRPALPPASTEPFKPEPTLASDDYEHILSVLQNMAVVMERSPSAFETMGEESLRSHFLVQLNGQYEGQATGETFNYSGKTDILLRVEGRNIFIGECKFWNGPKKLLETLDQLLSYSSWRDTKVALLIFNRRKNLSEVLSSVMPAIEAHPNYKRALPIPGETRFRVALSHKDDPSREMLVTILVFDVPTASS